MKKIINFIIIGSIVLVFAGMIIFVVALSTNKEGTGFFNNGTIVSNTYKVDEDFNNIIIEESVCDINIIYKESDSTSVISKELSNIQHIIEVVDNTLTIKENDQRAWYEKLFNFYDTEITIYLNINTINDLTINTKTGDVNVAEKLTFNNVIINGSTSDIEFDVDIVEDVKIEISTGDIEINNVSCKNMDLKVSTGDIEIEDLNCLNELKIKVSTGDVELNNISCMDFYSTGSTGRITLNNVIASNKMNIKRDTGDVKLNKCDSLDIEIETSTGSVKGTLLSNKIFNVDTDTGRKDVPNSVSGGNCKITTDTGDIIIDIVTN